MGFIQCIADGASVSARKEGWKAAAAAAAKKKKKKKSQHDNWFESCKVEQIEGIAQIIKVKSIRY
jgi:hypothetical protein